MLKLIQWGLLVVIGPVGLVALALRTLRWLAIAQQKEYRWDRLWLYFQTPAGRRDVWKIWFSKHDLTPLGLKRPVRTGRNYLLGATFSLVFGSVLAISALVVWQQWSQLWLVVLVAFGWYVLIPELMLVSILPSALIKEIITQYQLRKAQSLIQAKQPLIIGITGSYGKSTTKHLIAQVLRQKYEVFSTPKSHNNRLSVARAITSSYQGEPIAVIEYAAYTKGEIKHLTKWFQPQMAVITGLAPQHLALFGSLEAIVQAKSELVRAVPDRNKSGRVFHNGEDPGALQICHQGGASKPLAYAGDEALVPVQHVGLSDEGRLSFVWRGHTVATKLVGRQYLSAAQAAIAVGLALEVPELDIVQGLTIFQPSDNFLQLATGRSGITVIDDGATTNATGFRAGLQLLKAIGRGKTKILITAGIVDLGQESAEIHAQLARSSRAVADQVLYLGSVGLDQFAAAFKSDLWQDETGWQRLSPQISNQTVVLIEGRIPTWLRQELAV